MRTSVYNATAFFRQYDVTRTLAERVLNQRWYCYKRDGKWKEKMGTSQKEVPRGRLLRGSESGRRGTRVNLLHDLESYLGNSENPEPFRLPMESSHLSFIILKF